MKRTQKRRLPLLILTLTLTLCIWVPSSPSVVYAELTDATVQSYEQQLADIAAKQQQVLNTLESVRNSLSDAQQQKASYDELVSLSLQKKQLAEEQLQTLERQIAEREALIADTENDIAVQRQAFLSRMVTLYEEGEASYLGLLLGAENLTDFLSRMDQITSIQAYDERVIDRLREQKDTLEQAKASLEVSVSLQNTTIDALNESAKEAQEYADKATALMTQLAGDEAAALQTYYKYKAKTDELNEQLQKYLEELQAKQNSEYVGGELSFPLPLDVQFYVSSEYGWRDLWGTKDFHLGLDMACAAYTPIYAANAGKILKSEEHYSYGNYVLIDHGGGQSTLYAHMIQRLVNVGDVVEKGQQIGLVGSTGNSSGPHLHFEVRINGKTDQPRNYIVLPGNK